VFAVDDLADFQRLLAGLRAGDPGAVDETYRRYGPFLRAVVRRQLHPKLRARFDSIDFVQDVWASFLAVPHDRFTFETPQALLGFLTSVAQNKVVEVFRKRFGTQKDDVTREQPVDEVEGGGDGLVSQAPTPSQWAVAGEEWERILSQFPAGHREVVRRLREGYTYEDIARMANVSVSTVNRVVARLKALTDL
jgi:RNA polymerase sigma factor (sigma-70 family)